jgi:hypothetical protein
VRSEDHPTWDSALKVCGAQGVDQVIDRHLTRPEEPEEEEDVAEHETKFLDALKGLEAARKYICQFNTENNITVICNKVQNEL